MFEWAIPLWQEGLVFLLCAAIIGFVGTKLTVLADTLADRTGLGEALTGLIFLGFVTALPGLVASVMAAVDGHPALAISNAVGGIGAQTVALAVADLVYRKANLEHAAASAVNLMQTAFLILLLTLPLLGIASPGVTVGHVHPVTGLLILTAGSGLLIVSRTRRHPMWNPRETERTVLDEAEDEHMGGSLTKIAAGLLAAALVTAVTGAALAESAGNLVALTNLPEAVVGGLFMAVATSLPELVTSIAAVRQGAVTLAVSGIVGGNFFDVLFIAAADIAYFDGSLYHASAVGDREVFLLALTILLNVILLAGLLHRQRQGPAGIGVEGVAMIGVYACGFLVLGLMM